MSTKSNCNAGGGRSVAACSPSSETPETDRFRAGLDGMREINQRDRLLFHARKLERERDAAREDRDAWKDSCARYHKANEWLDAERSTFIAALRVLDSNHPLLPENEKCGATEPKKKAQTRAQLNKTMIEELKKALEAHPDNPFLQGHVEALTDADARVSSRFALLGRIHAESVGILRTGGTTLDALWVRDEIEKVIGHPNSENVEHVHPLPAWAEGYYRVRVHTTIKCRKHSGW